MGRQLVATKLSMTTACMKLIWRALDNYLWSCMWLLANSRDTALVNTLCTVHSKCEHFPTLEADLLRLINWVLNVISFLRCTRQRAPLIKYIVCTRSLSLSLCSYPLVFSRNQAKSRLGRRICICAAVFSFWCYSKYAFTYSRCDWRWWCPNARNVQPTSRCLHNFLLESIRYSPRTLTRSPHWQHEANNRGNCCILQPQAALQLSNSRLNDNNTHTHTHTRLVTWQLHGLAVLPLPTLPVQFPVGLPC